MIDRWLLIFLTCYICMIWAPTFPTVLQMAPNLPATLQMAPILYND